MSDSTKKDAFINGLDYGQKHLKLEIYTAHQVDDRYLEEIAEILMKKYNFIPSEVVNIIDPDLIGGVKVVFDTKVIDGTLKGKLENIQKQMVKKGYED